jgi:dynein light intermediate chain, axonemal
MTIAAYQALYESSIAFGMRKALMAEQKKAELHTKVSRCWCGTFLAAATANFGRLEPPPPPLDAQIQVLSAEVSELEHQVSQLGSRCEEMESLEKERYAHEEEKHAQEVAKHKAVNDQLKDSLEALLAPPAMKK